ncbi:MAG TPA: sugar phosphate isomerase/epimerase family protein [Pirellulales bacterium]|nr:sugar phosphate isomerase/epimerase family protein [Pirellulales bacterium]
MIASCVTISLVEEARGGPFVFWDDLVGGCRQAKELGFDAVEVFAPGPAVFDDPEFKQTLNDLDLRLAAAGTGAGWVIHKLQLCSPVPEERAVASRFVRSMIDAAGSYGAPAIIGSMQGRHGDRTDRASALAYLSDALHELGDYAAQYGVPLIFEPLNRYETDLLRTIVDGVQFLDAMETGNVRLLADLFHMNIEEADPAAAIRSGGRHIGHIHFVDSNRRAAGMGHTDFGPIAEAIREIGYEGYLSAEALPLPDPVAAARQTMKTFSRYFA